jgi:hypothetical protein
VVYLASQQHGHGEKGLFLAHDVNLFLHRFIMPSSNYSPTQTFVALLLYIATSGTY